MRGINMSKEQNFNKEELSEEKEEPTEEKKSHNELTEVQLDEKDSNNGDSLPNELELPEGIKSEYKSLPEEKIELSSEEIENLDELLSDIDEEVTLMTPKGISEEETEKDEVKVVSIKELTEKTFKRNTIEAALLAAQRPIGVEEISIKLEMSKAEIEKLIQELAEDYMDRTTAIEIVQIGEGYAMQIKPEYTEKIVKFASGGLIPKAVMRTLTIIAVKQPLMKSLLIKMRGSTAYDHCKFLIDRGYVTAYRKGRSSVLETTDQFADTFGLSRNVETLKNQLIEQLDIQNAEEESEETFEKSVEASENPQEEADTDALPTKKTSINPEE
jgi:segregation and condensation protein B